MTAADLFITYRPLRGGWTDPITEDRQSGAPFRAELRKTERLLLTEARALGASDVIVEMDVAAKDLRSDGSGIRGDRKAPEFPGVRVFLVATRFGDLRYACDAFEPRYAGDLPGWEVNVRAIALGLEALRRVERYGIARRGEQYRGFGELPPGTPLGPSAEPEPLTTEMAARLLAAGMDGITYEDVLADFGDARTAYRVAAKRVHTDNPQTGDVAAFRRVQAAWEVIERHHGGES